jgi:hypothetical protein
MRLRDNLVVNSTQAVHRMQKALFEMNLQLSNVISDIVGETGFNILEAIIAGQRDPKQLAGLCSSRIKASRETAAKSLHGNWDDPLLFALKVALETYRFTRTKIRFPPHYSSRTRYETWKVWRPCDHARHHSVVDLVEKVTYFLFESLFGIVCGLIAKVTWLPADVLIVPATRVQCSKV